MHSKLYFSSISSFFSESLIHLLDWMWHWTIASDLNLAYFRTLSMFISINSLKASGNSSFILVKSGTWSVNNSQSEAEIYIVNYLLRRLRLLFSLQVSIVISVLAWRLQWLLFSYFLLYIEYRMSTRPNSFPYSILIYCVFMYFGKTIETKLFGLKKIHLISSPSL